MRHRPAPASPLLSGYALPGGVAFSVVWTSAFIAAKIGLRYTDPISLLAMRFVLAGAILAGGFFLLRRRGVFRRELIIRSCVFGLLGTTVYLALSYEALRYLSPALVVIIASCAPFFTAFLAWLSGLERLPFMTVAGICIGFAGVVLIVAQGGVGRISIPGLVYAGIGTLSFSAGTIYYRQRLHDADPFAVNAIQLLGSGIALAIVSAIAFRPGRAVLSPVFFGVLLYLAVVVSIGAMLLWFFLIRKAGPGRASVFLLLNPAFGAVLSRVFFGTPITAIDWAGIACVAAGLFVTTQKIRFGREKVPASGR